MLGLVLLQARCVVEVDGVVSLGGLVVLVESGVDILTAVGANMVLVVHLGLSK